MHILTEADVEFVGIQESQKIVKPSEFRDEIDDLFENGESMEGVKFPWRKTTGAPSVGPLVSTWKRMRSVSTNWEEIPGRVGIVIM